MNPPTSSVLDPLRLDSPAACDSAVLQNSAEADAAVETLKGVRLRLHVDRPKNWDSLRALRFILRDRRKNAAVVDLGCSRYGRLLYWLRSFGYTNLHGCDWSFKEPFNDAGIAFAPQNLEQTAYAPGSFDFASCLSVIEHGVDPGKFFAECRRIVRPGGHLLLSTDYWQEAVVEPGRYDKNFQCWVKVFTRADIEELVALAASHGFALMGRPDWTCGEKVVYWKDMDLRFTFVFLAFRLGE